MEASTYFKALLKEASDSNSEELSGWEALFTWNDQNGNRLEATVDNDGNHQYRIKTLTTALRFFPINDGRNPNYLTDWDNVDLYDIKEEPDEDEADNGLD